MSDNDSPWKEALDQFLPAFLHLVFPEVYAGIDWARGYESLDKELLQVTPESELGRRIADKLYKVWRKEGSEAWVLVHLEVQHQPEDAFEERMFVYHYRFFDRFRRPIVSLAVLGDDRADWRPTGFGYDLWGCSIRLVFPVAKLMDWRDRQAELAASDNPFAAILLAHLKTQETRGDAQTRYVWKLRIIKGLYERGWTAEEIRQLFRVIDWMMDLPRDLESSFQQELFQFEEDRRMPYVTSVERLAQEKGRQEGRVEGRQEGLHEGLLLGIRSALLARFGQAGLDLLPLVEPIADVGQLRAIADAIPTAKSLEELQSLIRETRLGTSV